MGLILAIAYGAASRSGGWASLGAPASLLLAMLTALGLWLGGRQRAQFAADTAGGGYSSTPDLVRRLAPGLAWRLRLRPEALSPAAALVPPRSSAGSLPPGRRWARPPLPDPAASSSLPAPPGADPDAQQPPHVTPPGLRPGVLIMR